MQIHGDSTTRLNDMDAATLLNLDIVYSAFYFSMVLGSQTTMIFVDDTDHLDPIQSRHTHLYICSLLSVKEQSTGGFLREEDLPVR